MTTITRGCGARWTGPSRSHCAGCHLTFSGQTAFEKHRKTGICLTPEEAGLIPRPDRKGNTVLYGWPGTWAPEKETP